MTRDEYFHELQNYLKESAELRRTLAEEEEEGSTAFYKRHLRCLESLGLHDYYESISHTVDGLKLSKIANQVDEKQELYELGNITWEEFTATVLDFTLVAVRAINKQKQTLPAAA